MGSTIAVALKSRRLEVTASTCTGCHIDELNFRTVLVAESFNQDKQVKRQRCLIIHHSPLHAYYG